MMDMPLPMQSGEIEQRRLIHMFFNEMRDCGVEVNEEQLTLI